MRRLLLYALAVPVALLTGALTWAISESWFAFASLGVGLVWGLCWAARRFPAMRRVHFRAAALLTLASAVVLAVVFPSISVCYPAPARPHTGIHAPGEGCAIDRLMTIRLAIVAVGIVWAWALTALGSRRASADRSPHAAAAV